MYVIGNFALSKEKLVFVYSWFLLAKLKMSEISDEFTMSENEDKSAKLI